MSSHLSDELFKRANLVTPAGVHSDFRYAFPHFFAKAEGAYIEDVDGNRFLDYHMAFGSILLGHRNSKVLESVKAQLESGDIWGMGSNRVELEVAEKIAAHVPSAEQVRFCNSGSEATYHALRLARAFTHRKKIVKFEGSYNGWHDYLDLGVFPSLEKIGQASPNSGGMLKEAVEQTLVTSYNDIARFEDIVNRFRNEIAAVIIEPILHSCGCILPKPGFLESLREITARHNIVLIFDEVITGFRHSLRGAQELLGVTPDMTVFAKALGNGFPCGAVCGSKEIMEQIEPIGDVHMAGTFSGHPVSMAAAKATIEQLEQTRTTDELVKSGDFLRSEISKIIDDKKIRAKISSYRSIFTIYFIDELPSDYRNLKMKNDDHMFSIYCSKMHEQGIFIAPQSYKRCHISAAHKINDLKATVDAIDVALDACKSKD
jgi:glutamate-1-semialdehyde 2,1-aminomutase